MARVGSPDSAPIFDVTQTRVRIRNLPLQHLVAYAWRIKDYQVAGPEWMLTAKFDIEAKISESGPASAVPEMVRSLLVERFRLRAREDSGLLPVYALVVGKDGIKLARKPPDGVSSPGAGLAPGTMELLATFLSTAADRPVVDDTRLEGQYMVPLEDISKLTFVHYLSRHPIPGLQESKVADTDIFTLVRSFGLRLEPRKLPLRRLTVEHIDNVPSAN